MPARQTLIAIAAAAGIAILPVSALAGGPKGNLVAAAMNSPEHKTLVTAVKAAGLVDTLASGGPFTVFAPTNDAFAASGIDQAAIDALTPEQLEQLTGIADAVLQRLDPAGKMTPMYHRHDA